MSLNDRIKEFTNYNPDFILEFNGEFLLAVDVDCSTLPSFQRDLIASYGQEVLSSLSNRLEKYLNNKYKKENTYKPLSKQYEIRKIEGTEKYRRIFYYSNFSLQKLIPLSFDDDSLAVKNALDSKISYLDFNPSEEDKNTVVTKTTSGGSLNKNLYTEKFNEWYVCAFEEKANESPIKTGLNIILKSLAKKGSWIKEDENIRKSSKDDFSLVPLNKVVLNTKEENKKVVMVTHHCPSTICIPEKYRGDKTMNPGYVSNLEDFILDNPQIKLWTHGHMHNVSDYMIGSTRVVCNPRGYYMYEDRADHFKPIELEV